MIPHVRMPGDTPGTHCDLRLPAGGTYNNHLSPQGAERSQSNPPQEGPSSAEELLLLQERTTGL
ncbi:hypothetical protein GCM10027414_09740 [Humibacter ginsengiterrae]